MHGIKPTFALTASLALLFAGCEWSGSSDSNSWSNAYDAMNFSGSYRTVTSATTTTTTTTTDATQDPNAFSTTSQSGGTFGAGAKTASGQASHGNIVPGSFQASAGGYVWSDDGNGKLVFTNPNSGSTGSDVTAVVEKSESLGTLNNDKSQQFDLSGSGLVPGSVTVKAGSMTFKDDGSGKLVGGSDTASGTVNYEAGAITLNFKSTVQAGQPVSATYKYNVSSSTSTTSSSLSGSGLIQYSSGAWSLQVSPGMPSASSITLRYSYYIQNSGSTATYTEIATTTGTKVTAISVSQSGQNLSMHFNNGIVMTGRFTGIRQTGKINQDTSTGYNTYNAQFEVASGSESKMVGTLNYDLQLGVRTLNGTWTWGKNTYDVQAVGPAWLNSADTSTLQYEVVTSSK